MCPADDFAHEIVHVRPNQRRDAESGRKNPRRISECLAARSRPVTRAKPAGKRRPIASLARWTEIKTWALTRWFPLNRAVLSAQGLGRLG